MDGNAEKPFNYLIGVHTLRKRFLGHKITLWICLDCVCKSCPVEWMINFFHFSYPTHMMTEQLLCIG